MPTESLKSDSSSVDLLDKSCNLIGALGDAAKKIEANNAHISEMQKLK